jgi:S1-C subfamily serine protease
MGDERPTPGYGPWQQPPTWENQPPGWPGYQQPGWPVYPPPRRRRGFGTLLSVLALVTLAALGLVAWTLTRPAHHSASPAGVATPPAGATDAASIADAVSAGLVDVTSTLGLQGAEAAGTGMVLTADGRILTNNHVVEGATDIKVTDIGNGRTYQASVVGYDRSHDIAVLQAQGASGLTTVGLGDSDKVAVGDAILGIGNAGGRGGAPSVAPGTVTALDQTITATDDSGNNAEQLDGLIVVNANIQAGDSGGPLVNAAGQVIGMDTAASSRYHFGGRRGGGGAAGTGQGFAIPINDALPVVQQIAAGTASDTVHVGDTALLGVSVSDTGGAGAAVEQVAGGGPAAKAGLSAGDIITAIDDQHVDSPTALTGALDRHHPGDKVTVHWLDQTQREHTASTTLIKGPAG